MTTRAGSPHHRTCAAHLSRARDKLAAQGLAVYAVRADPGDPQAAAGAVDDVGAHLGPIDVLVNSACAAQVKAGATPGGHRQHHRHGRQGGG